MDRLKIIFKPILALVLGLLAVAVSAAQEPLDPTTKREALEAITSNYEDWNALELNGKLRMNRLPVSPSVKIYMERDSLIRVSVRVSLLGEVARVEVDSDSLLLVNKMNQRYLRRSLDSLIGNYPVTLTELQDLLLGRAFLMGSGTLEADDADCVSLFTNDIGGVAIVPEEMSELSGLSYGFQTDSDGRLTLVVAGTPDEEILAILEYSYPKSGSKIDAEVSIGTITETARLELDTPKPTFNAIKPFKPGKGYREASFRECLKF